MKMFVNCSKSVFDSNYLLMAGIMNRDHVETSKLPVIPWYEIFTKILFSYKFSFQKIHENSDQFH